MITKYLVAVALTVAGTTIVATQQKPGPASGAPDVDLKTATTRELLDGNVDKAIEQYRDIATRYRTTRPDIAAEALVRLAQSYERLARPEARAVYAELVRDFAAFPAAARAAERIGSRTSAVPQTVTPRLVVADSRIDIMRISPDGRFLLGHPQGADPSRPLILKDLVTGTVRTLSAGATTAVLGPGSRLVAYQWSDYSTSPNPGRYLKVIGVEAGAEARTVVGPLPAGSNIHPQGWSPDGSSIFVVIMRNSPAPSEFAWVNAATGVVTTVVQHPAWREALWASPSPDGKTTAFEAKAREGLPGRHIFTIDGQGRETLVVGMAGQSKGPIWSPDGSHLIFKSDRNGTWDLWAVRMAGAVTAGEPFVVSRNFSGWQIGTSHQGDLFYRQDQGGENTVVEIDRTAGSSRIVRTLVGQNASWSPNGDALAFIKPRDETNDLVVRAASGDERVYSRAGLGAYEPLWLGDSSGVVVFVNQNGDGQPGGGFYRLDRQSGAFTRLVGRIADSRIRSQFAALTPDGSTLYLAARTGSSGSQGPWTEIVAVSLATGAERQIAAFPGEGITGDIGMDLSPDGSQLALKVWAGTNADNRPNRLALVGTDGTGYREIFGPFLATTRAHRIKWTPDGQSLIFFETNRDNSWRVMRISAAGGSAVPDGLSSAAFGAGAAGVPNLRPITPMNLDVSPDGRSLVISAQTFFQTELWTLENLAHALSVR